MKKYKILCTSITGIKGKQLLQGQVHAATEFTGDHIAELVSGGFIEETTEETAPEMQDHIVTQEDLDTNPDLVANGINLGDTIQVPVTPPAKPGRKK